MKIISIIIIKKLKFNISKKIFYGNETHILWVWRSWEGVVVTVFDIMEVDLTCTSGSIATLLVHHRGKLLLYHPQVLFHLVKLCVCGNILFCFCLCLLLCLPCLFLCLYDSASHFFFSSSLNWKVTDRSKRRGLSEGGHSLAVVSSQVCSAINSTSTLPSSNFLPSLKLGCCIYLGRFAWWTF